MKPFRPLLCVLATFIVSSAATAQTVSTLVAGPAAFDDALSLDANGNLYASYYYGAKVTRIAPDGTTSNFAQGLTNPNGSTIGPDGAVYVAEAGGNRVWRILPDTSAAVFASGIANPVGLVFDAEGNLYVAQYQSSRILKRDPDGNLSLFMSGSGLNGPVGLQMDDVGNLYIGNFNDGKILKRTPAGAVTVIGDVPGWLGFIALAGDSIYACGFQSNRIYRAPIDGSGMTVFAGTGAAGQIDGDVATATFNGPNGIVASPDGDTLYVTDHNSRAVRVISGVATPTAVEQTAPPAQDREFGSHPNPFNPRTTLRYVVDTEGPVSLRVFDARGRQVADLVRSLRSAGEHEAVFDAAGLPSGVYFAQLVTADRRQRLKLVLAQ